MGFDFTKIIAEETKKQEATAKASSSGNSFGFNTLYPFGNGRLELKFIGNEPSGTLYREITFHKCFMGDNKTEVKVPCLHEMYGMDCPICDAVRNVQDQLDDKSVFRKYGYKKQGIMFARLLGFSPENYFKDNKNPPKVGDVVLFMFPKSVINELRNLIVEFSDELDTLFTNNITRSVTLKIGTQSNGFPEYSFYVKGNSSPLIVDASGEPDEAGFATYMASMPNLNEVKFPSQPNEDIMNTHKALVEQINNEYFGAVSQVSSNPQPMNQNTTPVYTPQAPVYTPPVNPPTHMYQDNNTTGTPVANPQVQTTATPVIHDVHINANQTSVAEQDNKGNVTITQAPPINEAPKFEQPIENTEATTDPRGPRKPCFGDNKYDEECANCPWTDECI